MRSAARAASVRPESNPLDGSVGELRALLWWVSMARMASYGWEVRRWTNSAIRTGSSATLRSFDLSSLGQSSMARSM